MNTNHGVKLQVIAQLAVAVMVLLGCSAPPSADSEMVPGGPLTAVDQQQPAELNITSVTVSWDRLVVRGASETEGACVWTELLSNGERVSWWPLNQCAKVTDGHWAAAVDLPLAGEIYNEDHSRHWRIGAWIEPDPSSVSALSFDPWPASSGPDWAESLFPSYEVSLSHPMEWSPVAGYADRLGGEVGFLQVGALDGKGWTLEEACDSQARHKLLPYGSQPVLESVDGLSADGCLIVPSEDQPADMRGQAAFVMAYPSPIRIGDEDYAFLVIWSDVEHVRRIIWSLRFSEQSAWVQRNPSLHWEQDQEDGSCQSLTLSADGLAAIGACDDQLEAAPYFGHWQYLGLWPDWLARFSSFQYDTGRERVILQGRGDEEASESWQRALASWSRLTRMELKSGRSGASWGTALAGHWEIPDTEGLCRFLQVDSFGYGYASVARCEGGDAQDLGRGWLLGGELERFDEWFYGRQPVHLPEIDFFGVGSQPMTAIEETALLQWAESVQVRLAGGAAVAEVKVKEDYLELGSTVSPDGRWVASVQMMGPYAQGDDELYRTTLTLAQADGGREWAVVDSISRYGLGYTLPTPFHWSSDGRYLFYTNLPVPDGCAVFVNASDLHRFDLSSGTSTEIVAGGVSWLSISPDESDLAMVRWNGQSLELVLEKLSSGSSETTVLDPGPTQGGSIVWAPDGSALVLTLAFDPCDPARWRHSVLWVDSTTLDQRTLVTEDHRLPTTEEWTAKGPVLLVDRKGERWLLDVSSGDLSLEAELEPTPWPLSQTYTDEALAVSLNFPDGWFVDGLQGTLAIITSWDTSELPTMGGVPLDRTKIDLVADGPGRNKSLNALVAEVREDASGPEALQVLWEEEWQLDGGEPAVRMQITAEPGGEMALLLAVVNGHSVRLIGYGDLRPFDTVARTLRSGV